MTTEKTVAPKRRKKPTAAAPVALPQLRLRTEFSFRQTFAPIKRVGAALKEMGVPAAGIVDSGTWGHVRWAKEAAKQGFEPLFGTELTIPQPTGLKPTAWALARDTAGFYRFSTAARAEGANVAELFEEYGASLVRFAGGALDDAKAFDYVDLNPATPILIRRALRLAERTGKPLVITSDNSYSTKSDYGAFMAICGQERITPQHILSLDELRAALPQLGGQDFDEAVKNTCAVPLECAKELRRAPLIEVPGDLRALTYAGRDKRLALGHLSSWPEEYAARLERELGVIAEKNFASYFIVVADLISWAKERMLVGPGRGSSAGSLVCYCLGITEVDPIPHGLIFERFIDVTRSDLPDIDIDFSDTKREQVFVYLAEKYKQENVARIGNINSLQPKSALAEVCKRLRVPDADRFDVVNVLVEYSSGDSRYGHALEDTLTLTDKGRAFCEKHPAALVVRDVESHAWHTGVHAAGVIVCNVPVVEYCTVGPGGVGQIDKPDSEYLNLLKIDALGLRTLGIIEDAGVIDGDTLYGLKMDDPEVLRVFDERKFCGIFQFEGDAQRSVAAEIEARDFRTLDHVTALARPGPLGGGATQKYISRHAGREEVTYRHPSLEPILADTYGVVLYQEQVMQISRDIGRFPWAVVSEIRKAMSASKGKEYFDRRGEEFVRGAAESNLTREEALAIWDEICTFGAWGMNRAHTCAYATISYWCAYMKRYHGLAYAAACLRSAKDDDQTMAILREMNAEGVDYTAFDAHLSDTHWSVQNGRLVGGFQNLVGFGPAKSRTMINSRANGGLTAKQLETISKAKVKFSELYPILKRWPELHANPEAFGCRPGSRIIPVTELPERGDVLIVGRVVKKELRDDNETVRVQRRNGRRIQGQSLFLDLFVSDDSGGPLRVRIGIRDFDPLGRRALSNLVPNQDVIMVRGRRIPNFNMVNVENIRCLTNPDAFKSEAEIAERDAHTGD